MKNSSKSIRLVTIVFAAAALLAGCGGEDRLTKAEYIKQGNAICKKGQADIEKLSKELGELDAANPTPELFDKVGKFLDKANVVAKRTTNEIKELKPPKADQEKIDKFHAALNKADAQKDKQIDKFQKGDREALSADNPQGEKANELAQDYGLKDCQIF